MPLNDSKQNQDPFDRRSIRQIVLPSQGLEQDSKKIRTRGKTADRSVSGVQGMAKNSSGQSRRSSGSAGNIYERKRSSKKLWFIAGGSVLLLYIVFSFFFSGAEVKITPRFAEGRVGGEFTAYIEPKILELGYKSMVIEKEGSRLLDARGEKFIEEKASGKIIVYNDYGEESQILIKNTRFEGPGGLIYRIPKSIVVPGQRTVVNAPGGKEPGSIETEIFADSTGENYNIVPSRFSIPGLKGDPRYSSFWAESKDAMTGGFSGNVPVVDKAEETAARTAIRKELRQNVLSAIEEEIPEGFMWFGEEGLRITNNSLINEQESGKVKVKEKVSFEAILFNEVELAKHIARASLGSFSGEDVTFNDRSGLSFSFLDQGENNNSGLRFSLNGPFSIIWIFDTERLKADLSGKSKGDINMVLSGYPAISKAEVITRPFWSSTFPENVSKIKIELLNVSEGE